MSDAQADQIATNATKPKRMQTEAGSVEQHSLPDQIEADKYVRKVAAAKSASALGFIRKVRIAFGSEV